MRKPIYLNDWHNKGLLNLENTSIDVLISIIESVYDGIYITDGNANTLYINQSYTVISGLSESSVIGKNMRDLIKEGLISTSGTILALEKREAVSIEQQFATGKRALITSTPIFDSNNEAAFIVTIVRDLSELYDLRDQLNKSSQKADKYYEEVKLLRQQFLSESKIAAVSPSMQSVLEISAKVAALDTPVLILGETGVGKERIASYIYKNSKRSKQNFIKVNCGAIPDSLIESELFGYSSGAFTGANSKGKLGYFGVADNGTIFLDEIGDLSLKAQVKLLRAIQEQEIERVGSDKPIKINVRILAATNRDLKDLINKGTFREDLYYRLSVFPITIPPLRERTEDIIYLAESMLLELNQKYDKNKSFSESAMGAIREYGWPGNVRELKNVIERAFIMSNDSKLSIAGLNKSTQNTKTLPKYKDINIKSMLEQIEAEYILLAYKEKGSIREAAKSLSMDPTTYNRKRIKYTKLYHK